MNPFFKILFASIITLVACNPTSSQSKGFVIAGTITKAEAGTTVYLNKFEGGALTLTDSAKIDDDGKFELSGLVDEPTLYSLMVNNQNIVLAIDNKPMQVTGTMPNFADSYEVFNSDDSRAIKSFVKSLTTAQAQADAMNQQFADAQKNGIQKIDSVREALTNQWQAMQTEQLSAQKKFVEQHKNDLAAIFAANYINPRNDYETLNNLLQHLQKNKPKSKYTTQLAANLLPFVAMQNVAVGKVAPDITLTTPDGVAVALSSLRGRVVLIDFWASWCGPCRKENPNVVRTYNKYKAKGFEIYGISLDKDGNAWKQAIAADGIGWVQVSDLKYWDSAAAKLYGVQAIPQTFLLDRNGIIAARDLRGAALDAKVGELLQ
jgi:thiol-disulfide isomerase/thioredoxin